MTLAKTVTKTLDIGVKDTKIDLSAIIKSYDLTDTKFIFNIISNQGLNIDLTGSTAMYIVEYVHNSQNYAIQGEVDIVDSTTIAFNLPKDLKGYNGKALIGIYVTLTDGTKIDIKDIIVRIEPSIMDKNIDFSAKAYFKDFESIKAEVVLEGEKAKTEIKAALPTLKTQIGQLSESITDISEMYGSSRNLWDEEWEVGAINTSTGEPYAGASDTIRSKNFIRIPSDSTIYVEEPTHAANLLLFFYDENKVFLRKTLWVGGNTFTVPSATVPSETRYAKFRTAGSYGIVYNNNICINVSDKNDGTYTPHKNPITAVDHVARDDAKELKMLGGKISSVLSVDNATNNVLKPFSENGYYNTDTGVPVASNSYTRVPNAINAHGYARVYVNLKNNVNGYVAIACYKGEEATVSNYLGVLSFNGSTQKYATLTLKDGTEYIRLWIGSSNYDFNDFCLSFGEQKSYVPYEEKTVISASSLPSKELETVKLKGKIGVNFGDSIFGLFYAPDDISTRIAQLTGSIVYNCAFGGTGSATHPNPKYAPFSLWKLVDAVTDNDFSEQETALGTSSSTPIPDVYLQYRYRLTMLESVDFSKVDYITIAYGTNDFAFDELIDNSSNKKDVSTYIGAIRYAIEKIWNRYPQIKIFLCTPIYRMFTDGVDSDSKTQTGKDIKLTDFVQAMKDVANEYHIPCIDNYHDLGINKFNRLNYFDASDGTHPNLNGRIRIGEHIALRLY